MNFGLRTGKGLINSVQVGPLFDIDYVKNLDDTTLSYVRMNGGVKVEAEMFNNHMIVGGKVLVDPQAEIYVAIPINTSPNSRLKQDETANR